ncbi:MAG: hypothetical protein K2Y37_23705 [Pirellulales bacterium]|nr:hypothetical protein [Pirellulales bacterium]
MATERRPRPTCHGTAIRAVMSHGLEAYGTAASSVRAGAMPTLVVGMPAIIP